MKLYYETSLSAYILLQEVVKDLKINETIIKSKINGNIKKILKRYNKNRHKRKKYIKGVNKLSKKDTMIRNSR